MLKFKQYILEAATARQGLPHIEYEQNSNAPSMISQPSKALENLHKLIGSGHIEGVATEKTDGASGILGHDNNGFYIQMGKGNKIYHPDDPGKFAEQRQQKAKAQGKQLEPLLFNGKPIHEHQRDLFNLFNSNEGLKHYLKYQAKNSPGGESQIRGEFFYRPMGTHVNDGKHVRFVATHYNTSTMGNKGSFVVHTQLNPQHNVDQIKSFSTPDMKFDSDEIPNSKFKIDVRDLASKLKTIDPNIKSRSHPQWGDVVAIAKQAKARVAKHFSQFKPKFGTEETEGLVLHTPVRVKYVPDEYAGRKKELFKQGSR